MELKKLKNSISLYSDVPPSIFAAVCLVETLFRDIQDESGKSIQNNPVGDEMLPTKLVWLCRTLNNIYSENKSEFTRSIGSLEGKMTELRDVERELELVSGYSSKLETLKNRENNLRNRLEAAKENKQKCGVLEIECAELEKQLAELEAVDKDGLYERCASLTVRRDKLMAENNSYYENNIRPIEEEIATLDSDKIELDNKLGQLNKQKETIIFDIARVSGKAESAERKCEERKKELENKRQDLEKSENELSEIDSELKVITEQLAQYNDEITEKKQNELPQAKQLLEQITNNHTALFEELERLKKEIAAVEEKLPETEKELAAKENVYTTLTESLKTKSSEIETLEKNIKELRGKTDEEKHKQYKLQLDGDRQRLESIIAECNALESDIKKEEEAIVKAVAQQTELKNRKAKYESTEEKIGQLLEELAFVDSEAFMSKIKNAENRLALLSGVYDKLSKSAAVFAEVLGLKDKPELAELKNIGNSIKCLDAATEDLGKALVSCAESIKLEVN